MPDNDHRDTNEEVFVFPPSLAQERMCFIDQLMPGSSAFNLPIPLRIHGPLNLEVLQRVLREIVRRHEALRTTFSMIEGQLSQVIHPQFQIDLPVQDLRASPWATRETQALDLATREARRPFDLARGPLFRASVVQLADDDHLLLLAMHHLVADGWSFGILMDEMEALYPALLTGQPSPLPELRLQYADFAQWQRAWLSGEVLDKQLAFWKGQLHQAPADLDLPLDHPRPAVSAYRGATVSELLPADLTTGLKLLVRQENATPFMLHLAVFNVLLHRYTGQTDLVVGTPIANRTRAEIEKLAGLFMNTLALRTRMSDHPTFRELLGQVRETVVAAFAHQEFPFEKLVEALQPARNLSRNPLFQVMFMCQKAFIRPPNIPGLEFSHVRLDRAGSDVDLTFFLVERAEGARCAIEYDADLFEAGTIRRMLGHYRVLLEAILARPDQRVAELPLMSPAERQQVCVDWNPTPLPATTNLSFKDLFEAQAARTPKAVAVEYEGRHLTYDQLNQQANRLAHYLRRQNLGPESLVGICVPRSLEMAVGLVGILKAGAAYVPLDPAYPASRLAFMVQDAGLSLVLTVRAAASLMADPSVQLLQLDAGWTAIGTESPINPTTQTNADNLAYVIYTSGSTGTPKGVMISQQAMVNHNSAIVKRYGLQPQDRVLQFASLSFDVAVEELFPTWMAGATLVLRPNAPPPTGTAFTQWIAKQRLSVLNLPTAFWHEWVQELAADQVAVPEAVRLVVVGGEKVSAAVYQAWRKLPGQHACWLNAYGPTEATVTATIYEPDAQGPGAEAPAEIPIGRPLNHVQAFIVDDRLQPVPPSVPGELLLGGTGLARGYLRRPALTEKNFIANPFDPASQTRLYRTGDRARYRADGNIEYLGRIDQQVKIRGFRIEPGEVEAWLRQHAGVRDCAVVARPNPAGDLALTAYLVLNQDSPPMPDEINAWLKQRLPAYLIPSAYVVLEALPLTPSGKIDWRALPAPEPGAGRTSATPVPPRTPEEQLLAEIWEQVLGHPVVSVHDSFFELGGHSLKMMQVINRVSKVFHLDLPLRSLFDAPTLASLAGLIHERLLAEINELNEADAERLAQGGLNSKTAFGFTSSHLLTALAFGDNVWQLAWPPL